MQITDRADLTYYAKLAQHKVGYVAGQLELTSKCEQFCPNCDSWKKHQSGEIKDQFTFAQVVKLFAQLNELPTFEHLAITGGDPASHPDLEKILSIPRKFRLQINTALPKPSFRVPPYVWRKADALRVSLDAVNARTYFKMRGVGTDPEDILRYLEEIAHPSWATNTCVAPANVEEMPEIVRRLDRMVCKPRRANFLAVLDREVDQVFWKRYSFMSTELKLMRASGMVKLESSVAEDVQELRVWKNSEEALDVRCSVGAISFHIKCNGDVYPCCLVGGEAIVTRPEYRIGNVHSDFSLEEIRKRYRPALHYKTESCRKVCQWKQCQINRLAHDASKVFMRMP